MQFDKWLRYQRRLQKCLSLCDTYTGSIFHGKRYDLLWPSALAVIEQEALTASAAHCLIRPAALGERIGDYAAVATALL